MIDTVLFDFDGTIMDTNEVIIQSWQETFRTLEDREQDREVLLKTFGEPLEYTMRNFFPDIPVGRGLEIYRGYQRDNFLKDIHLFPGIRELLDELAARQIKMALVTSRLKHTTQQALDKFDMNKYFGYVVTADDVTRHKPDPQSAQIALDKIGSRPEDTIMMGDTLFDILCARNAGCTPVLVAWSMSLADKIRAGFAPEEAPDRIITDPAQILEML
ncbi:MAG: HAD-IA family hydrolase [Firmicutes bacterium]|nr:HAD-IA family hydrolase [Bacillota bacterium]